MQAPDRAGSSFFNYKKSHSIVLPAVCNATYEFILVDIGESGTNSDGSVLANSNLGLAMNDGLLKLPEPKTLPGTSKKFPYVFVADEAFPLKPFMVKPSAKNILDEQKGIYNYMISRARRVIENCFGICASRFRIFRRPIIRKVDTVVAITKAVVSLHNYLMRHESNYCPLVTQMLTHHLERGQENGERNPRIPQVWFQLTIKVQIILPDQLTRLGRNSAPTLIPMQDL